MSPTCRSARGVVSLLSLIAFGMTIVAGLSAAPADQAGTVRGVVWNSDNSPIPKARVRLRDLQTGRVTSSSETTENGQFTFGEVERGTYLVELISEDGKVLAVSQSFLVGPGETVSTVVRLASRKPWFVGMFSNAAAVVIAAASTVGLTAIGSHGPPVSPQ